VLPALNRMRRSADFTSVVRRGVRVRRGNLVVHHLGAHSAAGMPASFGLVVAKAVGGSVVRHRVSRRLRALLAERLESVPTGSATVVRALPDAAVATSAELGRDLDAALRRLGQASATGSRPASVSERARS
jgi:ribonuclease P protein component